jgi:predicted HTH transcriptional regulator
MAELLSDESDVSIKVVRFSGTNKTAMSQRKEFGNRCLILAMQQAMDYVEILDEVNVDVSGAQRRETPLFIFKAFREAWINACLHNSWNELTPPAIYLYSDRMEIVSYGGLPFGLSEEEFYRGESHPINKALQTIFTQLDYTEQTGHGVPSIIEAYSKEVFRISDHFISVTLPFAFKPEWVIAGEEEEQKETLLNKTQKLVFEYIKKNPDAVAESISKELGIGIATVNRSIGSLKKAGLIKRVGSRKAGHWTF